MPQLVEKPATIEAKGKLAKKIEEFIGLANTGTPSASVAKMKSPCGWSEPGQRPDFDEYTLVLKGELQVESEEGGIIAVKAGQAIIVRKGEWIRYSTPCEAEYVAICVPAFSPDSVHRDS